jgi:hypothetical protein
MDNVNGEYVVENLPLTAEEAKVIADFADCDFRYGDSIVKVFRMGVAHGRKVEAALAPHSVSYET